MCRGLPDHISFRSYIITYMLGKSLGIVWSRFSLRYDLCYTTEFVV